MQELLKDERDNRGKRYELAFILFSFFMAVLRSQGFINYSMLHRIIKRDQSKLQKDLKHEKTSCISYSQLKRILKTVDYKQFDEINCSFFGKLTSEDESLGWQAVDGKELRGTIDKVAGQTRNVNIVNMISHQDKQSQLVEFYDGSKESEMVLVRNYIKEQDDLTGRAFSFDALHTQTELLESIDAKGGVYLSQVKANQKFLLEDCQHVHENLPEMYNFKSLEKGHGRIECRTSYLYNMNNDSLEERWSETGIQTLVTTTRERESVKAGKVSYETSYFVSNLKLTEKSSEGLSNAVRSHWSVESDNNIRDTNYGEDKIICFDTNTSKVMAVCISWSLNLLRKKNIQNNLKALREDISADRNLVYALFN